MRQAVRTSLIAAFLLLPLLAGAQDNFGSRIKSKSAVATGDEPEVSFTPFAPLSLEAAPVASACMPPPVVRAFSSQARLDKFNAALNNYQACVRDYVEVNTKAANQHAEATNKAVADANAYFAELNKKPAGE